MFNGGQLSDFLMFSFVVKGVLTGQGGLVVGIMLLVVVMKMGE